MSDSRSERTTPQASEASSRQANDVKADSVRSGAARDGGYDGSDRRVAITGIGMISALGATREAVWEHMLAGLCGIRPVTLFDTTGFRSRVAAEVDLFDQMGQFSPLERRRWSRSDQLGVIATREALADSGLLASGLSPDRIGVSLGAGTGDLLRNESYYFTMLSAGIDHARPSSIYNHFSNTPVDVIASTFGLTGLRACFVSACSSSTIAIGHAAEAIIDGQLDAAVCGGTDALARLTFSGFNALRLMDPEPCRPFDASRNGMNIGEGASILVLEDYARAQARGAHIYAELSGYSLSCEAFHPTAPEPEGRAVATMIRAALESAGVTADEIDHVNCHGTATLQNDKAEAKGLHVVFGDRARTIPVNSVKAMIGHCLGAAGAMEAAVLALTIARGIIPPTINHTTTDPDCDLDIVANTPREMPVRCGLSTSLAFGGNDSALVMRAVA
jgi:3-oxoacyl-[acyl-carrier-protein] synthase II